MKKLKGSTNFVSDLKAKSVDIIALIAATENTFGIKTNPEETRKNKTISQAVSYIKSKMKKGKKSETSSKESKKTNSKKLSKK